MAAKEADLVDPFFDSEEDEVPVDMEMVFEAMKHVPLPDLDYPEQDESIAGDASLGGPLSTSMMSSLRDPILQGFAKRKMGSGEDTLTRKKGGGIGRLSKRMKIEVHGTDVSNKISPKLSVKGEGLAGRVTAAAAKVAAELAPNVVTGGVVAEAGPRPDFSLWTLDDDLLLKNALEAGAAMEALAKGAMRFSRRFTVRELRERWRALLYDPEISAQAAARMVEAELALSSSSRSKSPSEPRNLQEIARKRRANSVRTLYYKRRKKLIAENLTIGCALGLPGAKEVEGAFPESTVSADTVHVQVLMGPVEIVNLGAPLKESTNIDFEDRTFSQMFSLLAAGGVGAVIGALPADTVVDLTPDGTSAIADEEQHIGGKSASTRDSELELSPTGKKQERTLESWPYAEKKTSNVELVSPPVYECKTGQSAVAHANPRLAICSESAAKEKWGKSGDVNPSLFICNGSAAKEDKDSKSFANGALSEIESDLQRGNDCRSLCRMKTVKGITLGESRKFSDCTGTEDNFTGSEGHGDLVNGTEGDHYTRLSHQGTLSPKIVGKDLSPPLIGDVLVAKVLGLKNRGLVDLDTSARVHKIKLDSPCETCPLSTIVCKEMSKADNQLFSLFAKSKTNFPLSEANNEKCPWSARSGNVEHEQDDILKTVDVGSDCGCEGLDCRGGVIDERTEGNVCDETAADDRRHLDDSPDGFLPTVLTGESSTLDMDDIGPVKDSCVDFPFSKIAIGLEPFVCTLNTQDTEIPSLDDALLSPSSSLPSSASDQEEYLACTDSPLSDMNADGDVDCDDIVGAGVEEFVEGYSNYQELDRLSSGVVKVEPGNLDNCCQPPLEVGKFGTFIERCTGNMASNAGSKGERIWEEASEQQDLVEQKIAQVPPGLEGSFTPRTTQEGATIGVHSVGKISHQQFTPHLGSDDRTQGGDPGVMELQPSIVSSMSPKPKCAPVQLAVLDMATFEMECEPMSECQGMVSGSQTFVSSPAICKQELHESEEELESEEEMAHFSDAEAMILDMDLDPVADDEFSARAESRRIYRRHGRSFLRLEQAASAAMQRSLNSRGALAILYGRHLRCYISQTEVLIGRATQDNVVDIDLGKEGRANKVSRQQANIKLKEDGVFYLRNLGRRGLTVNNKAVETGQRAILGSNCLIEVGGMRFIFETNRKLVQEYVQNKIQHH